MKREFADENRKATESLKTLLADMDEAQFATKVGNGWTISSLLCHLALWDGRVAYTLCEWQRSGQTPSNIPKDATDFINQAARDVFAAVPARAAAELAIRRAESLDAWLETLDDAFCEKVFASGSERMLRRSLHRTSHVAQMREALGK